MKEKKIPQRKCIGCREMKPKNELLRIVKSADGKICADSTGKMPGRGAYICRSAECFEAVKKGHKLEKEFSCPVDSSVYDDLEVKLLRNDC